MENVVKGTQFDYDTYTSFYAKYKHIRIDSDTNTTFQINSAGGQEIKFKIPEQVHNLSRSIAKYTFKIPDNIANNLTGKYIWLPVDVWTHFREAYYQNGTATKLAEIMDLPNYLDIIWHAETKFEEYKNYDTFGLNDTPAAATAGNGTARFLRPSYIGAVNNIRFDGTSSSIPFEEPLHLIRGNLCNNATAGDIVINVEIPLGMIYNSIFSYDKDIAFNDTMLLRFVTASITRMGWTGTDANDPTIGVSPLISSGTLENISLFLAIESDQSIANGIMDKTRTTQVSMMIPYVTTSKQSPSQGSNQTITCEFSESNGRKLKRLYYAIYNGTESGNTIFDHSNVAQSKITKFYTTLDGIRRLDFDSVPFINTDPISGTDYLSLKSKLRGSLILNSNIYYSKWFFADYFDAGRSPSDLPLKPSVHNLDEGLPLNSNRKITLVGTMRFNNVSYNWYTIAILERLVTIQGKVIQVV